MGRCSENSCCERKASDVYCLNSITGRRMSLGQFAKGLAVTEHASLLGDSIPRRGYLVVMRFVNQCLPESYHHRRREGGLNSLCGLE